MPTIVLATRNQGKIAELSAMLEGRNLQVLGLDAFPELGEIPEDGETFEENALFKARTVSRHTGLVAVADDSGLEVDALGGRPGVHSARYSADEDAGRIAAGDRDTANNMKLLRELRDVPLENRGARFRCVMAAYAPNDATLIRSGAWEGRIAMEPMGDNGFGYDPLFWDDAFGGTAAQMDKEQKNARSHRGNALRALLEAWPAFWNKAANT